MAIRNRAHSTAIAARDGRPLEDSSGEDPAAQAERPRNGDDVLEPSQNRLRNVNRSIVIPVPTVSQAADRDKIETSARAAATHAVEDILAESTGPQGAGQPRVGSK
jgi:hypothetical protein